VAAKPKATTPANQTRVTKIEEIKAAKRQVISSFVQTTPNLKCLPDFPEPMSKRETELSDHHVFEDFSGIPNSYDSYGFTQYDYKKQGSSKSIAAPTNLDIKLLEQEKVSLVDLFDQGDHKEPEDQQEILHEAGHQTRAGQSRETKQRHCRAVFGQVFDIDGSQRAGYEQV
jgi:hypothetical protein